MAAEQGFASMYPLVRTFANDEEIEDCVDHLILERAVLHEQIDPYIQEITSCRNIHVYPNQPDDESNLYQLGLRIQSTEQVIESLKTILKIKPYHRRAPQELHRPFYNASQHLEIISKAVPLARRVECIIEQNANSPETFTMDVIDALNLIEAFDVYRDFAGVANTSRLPDIADTLPRLIRENIKNFPATGSALRKKLAQVQVKGMLATALEEVDTVKRQLDRLPLPIRLLLSEDSRYNGKETIRTFVRRVVLDVVWEKSRTSPKTELTVDEKLARACLQVALRFKLRQSCVTTHAELLFRIYSEPGMLSSEIKNKARLIRGNFGYCILPDNSEKDDSFDAIVALASVYQDKSLAELKYQEMRRANSYMKALGME